MKRISPELDEELCAFICGWDELEKTRGNEIIDMNLSDKVKPKPYSYRYDVLTDVENFLAAEEVKQHPQILQKMTAHRYSC